ncbi:uncharacterized protein LOC132760577 isoform X2 [Ruditapes philippinarum]|uniref:uncharacterized protein LOC132760577 isoform X2 n=1 Tax=Ruditapes philippinarum TaxID=129788 RepID=UPI00295AAB42|nr:uncharacterized protein LOC132760577 isoform X2 [Ruditapes philippinarum]
MRVCVNRFFFSVFVLCFLPYFVRGLHRHHKCLPVNAYLFLDRIVGDDVRVQKHNIYKIMDNTHDGSNIQVDTLNHTSIITITEGVKNKENMLKWPKIINDFHKGTTGVISATSLIDSISVYQTGNTNVATELFLVVNDETKVDDEEKLIKALKTMKTFIVYCGRKRTPNFWYCLATDENHFINLKDEVDADIESFLRLSCEDSNLQCNNNMYWTGHECKKCTHICSRQPSEDPPFCRQSCSYFRERKDEIKCNGSSVMTSYNNFRETKDESKDNGSSRMISYSIKVYLPLWLVVWLY